MENAIGAEAPERRSPAHPGRRVSDQTIDALRMELRRQNERVLQTERKRANIYLGVLAGMIVIGLYQLWGLLFPF
ncbi:MAG: hypothetical protein ABWZ40_00320 [Caulobacterales bacterium]